MKLLLTDFLRRWWWLFALCFLTAFCASLGQFPFVFAPATAIALMFDGQRGVFRIVRTLPVSRDVQVKTWWFIGVPLLPILFLPALVAGLAFSPMKNQRAEIRPMPAPIVVTPQIVAPSSPPTPQAVPQPVTNFAQMTDPQHRGEIVAWFAVSVQLWVGLGYAAFCFFLMQWAPTRPAENLRENVQQGIFGVLWGLSIPCASILIPALPRTPVGLAPWHFALFAAAPIFFVLSYLGASDVVQRRMTVSSVKARREADSQPMAIRGNIFGTPLFVAYFGGRMLLFLGSMIAMQIFVLRYLIGAASSANNPIALTQICMMGLLISVLTTESIGLRALRTLPLSTMKLAALISVIPWTAALASAFIAWTWSSFGDPSLPHIANFFALLLAVGGWATLTLAVMLHFTSSARIFFIMIFCAVPGGTLAILHTHAQIFAAIGIAAGVIGFALMLHGLKNSAAFYRPRGFFGMTPGQPSAVR